MPKSGEISRRTFIKGVAAGSALSLIPVSLLKSSLTNFQECPNILLLITYQHQASAMGCSDSSYYTPNIDNLANTGVRFTNCFTTYPLCAPSRSSLMTGQYPHENGVISNEIALDPGLLTLGEVFSSLGYRTAYFGKWHLHRSPQDCGFQHWQRSDSLVLMTREALGFIRKNLDPKVPFFVAISWRWPHPPRRLVKRFANFYPINDVPVPESFKDNLLDKPKWYRKRARKYDLTKRKVRRRSHVYRTMASQVDRWFGSVLRAIDERGFAGNTIIAYTSDHGEMLGSHRLRGKNVAFEESIKVPLILKIPNLIPNRTVVDDLVSNHSIPGTLIEAAGIQPPESFTGGSFLPSLMRDEHPEDEAVFIEHRRYRAIRTRYWKYVNHYSDTDELYDLSNDPLEMRNLVFDHEYAGQLEYLAGRLSEWWENSLNSVS